MFACCYANASVANYTLGLISEMMNIKDLEIKMVSSHCACLPRFPQRKFALVGKCSIVNCPYLSFPSSKRRILNIAIQDIPKTLTDFFRGFSYLRAGRGGDIIHFQQSSQYSFGIIPLIPLVLFSRQRKVVTLHSGEGVQGGKFLFQIYNRVDRIIVHSESMETRLLNMGVAKSKIVKVPHGVEIPTLFGLNRTEITFMGAPEERKGILTILDALRILKNKNINLKVTVYGWYSDSERKSTELLAASKKVDDCLVWGGRLDENEFDKKLQQSLFTLAVYNSATSGSSVATRAMSNATPVVASDIGGFKEYIDGGGVFLPPGNPEALAQMIESLLKNPQLLEELGAKGRERALQLFSWKEIANKTATIYERLL